MPGDVVHRDYLRHPLAIAFFTLRKTCRKLVGFSRSSLSCRLPQPRCSHYDTLAIKSQDQRILRRFVALIPHLSIELVEILGNLYYKLLRLHLGHLASCRSLNSRYDLIVREKPKSSQNRAAT